MDVDEMVATLEQLVRDPDVSASARIRAVEVLLRIDRSRPEDEREWERIVQRFGDDHAE
jgi:hypothetical protein